MFIRQFRLPLILTSLLLACGTDVRAPGPQLAAGRPGSEVVHRNLGDDESPNFPGLPDLPLKVDSKIPPSIQRGIDLAESRFSALSQIFGAYNSAKQVLELLGFLPDKEEALAAQFAQLHREINEWHLADENRDLIVARDARIRDMDTAADKLDQVLKLWPDIDWSNLTPAQAAFLSDVDTLSDEAANGAGQMSAFMRKFNPDLTRGEWPIFNQPNHDGGLVYDWRIGATEMIRLTTHRLLIMALTDPQFVTNQRHAREIRRMLNTVNDHYLTMVRGIECRTDLGPDVGVGCVDVYTGTSAVTTIAGPGCYTNVSGKPLTFECDEKVARETVRMIQVLRSKLPLFPMRVLLNTLQTLLAPLDPIANLQIRVADAPNHRAGSCLSQKTIPVPGDFALVAVIEDCAPTRNQLWTYDPRETTVKDDWGHCLTTGLIHRFGTRPGVGLGDCDGSDGQRWTYDTVGSIFHSAVNTVLAIPGDLWVPSGTPVTTAESMGDETQLWRLQEWKQTSGGRPGPTPGL
jgi:hypothetical protein